MGQTNLKQALERKYSLMAGELKTKQQQIAQVQTLFATLPSLSAERSGFSICLAAPRIS